MPRTVQGIPGLRGGNAETAGVHVQNEPGQLFPDEREIQEEQRVLCGVEEHSAQALRKEKENGRLQK